jgi:hypothetical protein
MLNPIAGEFRIPLAGSPGSFHFQRTPSHRHQGVDFTAETGRPILAVADGRIEIAHAEPAQGFAGYGRVVVLALSSGTRVLYAHLSRVDVSKNDAVLKGQVLGAVGSSQFRKGNAADDGQHARPGGARIMGSHLHLEVATRPYPMGPEAPYRLDPAAWLSGMPQPTTRRAVASRPFTGAIKTSFLADLARRIAETEQAVETATALLVARSLAGPAAMVRSAWASARATMESAARAADPRAAISDAATAWTRTVDSAAAYAQRTTDTVVHAAAAEFRHAQDEAWRALRDAGAAAAGAAGKVALGGGVVLLLVGLMFAGTLGVSAGGGVAGARSMFGSKR